MSAGRGSKRKRKRTQEGIRAHKTLIAFLLGIATLIGGIAVVLPRPTVTQSDPVDPNNPFSASFTISNTGFVPLRHVDVFLVLREVSMEPSTFTPDERFHMGDKETWLHKDKWLDRALAMDERFTITPADMFTCCGSARVAGAEFGIAVKYNPWILPWTRTKVFPFVTHKQSNGQLYWYPIANE